jgi:hypothetical protein
MLKKSKEDAISLTPPSQLHEATCRRRPHPLPVRCAVPLLLEEEGQWTGREGGGGRGGKAVWEGEEKGGRGRRKEGKR